MSTYATLHITVIYAPVTLLAACSIELDGPHAVDTPTQLADAGPDAEVKTAPDAGACFSALRPPPMGSRPGDHGCACTVFDAPATGYCIRGWALICGATLGFGENDWQIWNDGPCQPLPSPPAPSWCAEQGGTRAAAGTCPSGFHWSSSCCIPLFVTPAACEAADLTIAPRDQTRELLQAACPDGSQLRGFIEGSLELCCG